MLGRIQYSSDCTFFKGKQITKIITRDRHWHVAEDAGKRSALVDNSFSKCVDVKEQLDYQYHNFVLNDSKELDELVLKS